MKNNELTAVKAEMPLLDGLSQQVKDYVLGLVAENAVLKSSREILANNALETCNEVYSAGYRNTALHDGLMESTGDRNRFPSPIRALVSEATRPMETPDTDAAIAEIKLPLAAEVDAYRALVDNLGVIHSLKAPETDHLLAYYKAQGVDEFLNDEFVQEVAMRLADFNGETEESVSTVVWSGMPPEPEGNVWELEYVSRASFLLRKLKEFAANLRAGRKG